MAKVKDVMENSVSTDKVKMKGTVTYPSVEWKVSNTLL